MAEDTQELTRDIEVTRGDLTRNLDALSDRVSPGKVVERRVERTKSGAVKLKDRVMGTASSAVSSVKDTASSASGSAGGAVGSASSTATDTKDAVRQHAEGNPMAAGAIAFGIGWLISSLLPASEKETQAAGALVDAAKEHGQPLVEQAKSVGADVASTLQEKAQTAAQSVTETAKESAATVSEQAKGSAASVTEDAKDAKAGI